MKHAQNNQQNNWRPPWECLVCFLKINMAPKRSKLLENLEERKILIDILVKERNKEVILQRKETKNKEERRFMIFEKRYLLFK